MDRWVDCDYYDVNYCIVRTVRDMFLLRHPPLLLFLIIGLGWNGLLVIVSVLMDGVAAVDVAAAIDVDVCGASFIVT